MDIRMDDNDAKLESHYPLKQQTLISALTGDKWWIAASTSAQQLLLVQKCWLVDWHTCIQHFQDLLTLCSLTIFRITNRYTRKHVCVIISVHTYTHTHTSMYVCVFSELTNCLNQHKYAVSRGQNSNALFCHWDTGHQMHYGLPFRWCPRPQTGGIFL